MELNAQIDSMWVSEDVCVCVCVCVCVGVGVCVGVCGCVVGSERVNQ